MLLGIQVFMLVRMECIVRYLGLVNVLDCFNLAWKFDNKKFNMEIFTYKYSFACIFALLFHISSQQ